MKAKSFLFSTLAAICIVLAGCGKNTIHVDGVTVPATLALEVGEKKTLTAKVWPTDASDRSVSWSSDIPAVATVDRATGEVTAIAIGSAVITVTTDDGGKTAHCEVTVSPPEPDILPLIPDPVFRLFAESADTNHNGKVSAAEAAALASLDLHRSGNEIKISSLEGIEYFTGLTVLDFSGNSVSSVDLSKNTELLELYCNDNRLSSLDISKNGDIYLFNCDGNPGDGATFVVQAWFDNASIPSGQPKPGYEYYFSRSWTVGSKTITVDYRKVE